jgi:cell division protease FtsH
VAATRQEQREDTSGAPPAPRGSTPPPQPPRFRFSRNWILFALVLLAFNIFIASRAMGEPSRVRVPYSPYFLNQVRAGHVKEITSKGTAIQGTFKEEQRYQDAKPTTKFRTEIPAFADNDALSKLLQEKGRVRLDKVL